MTSTIEATPSTGWQPQPHPPLRPGALIAPETCDGTITADVVIIGSGMGGGALAYALAGSGLSVVIVERGDFLPREPENFDAAQMFLHHRYQTSDPWIDGHTGATFQPGVYHWVGGNTKMYGACLPRFRREDFEAFDTADGISPAWPIRYEDLAPYYSRAETIFDVHGNAGEDPTEPAHAEPYPHPAHAHEPVIERFAARLRRQGLQPFHMPNGMTFTTDEDRARASTDDGTPSGTDAKSDAETRLVRPALAHENVRLLTGTTITRLATDPAGDHITAAHGSRQGRPVTVRGQRFVLAAGAVNSAVLLLASATERHPDGLGNSSGLLGRNYMVHNSTFLIGFHPLRRNRTRWQKTLGLNDWYLPTPAHRYPLGNVQMLGKLQGAHLKSARPRLPLWLLDQVAARTVDLYLTTEDLPRQHNRVRLAGGRTVIDWTPTNLRPHQDLVEEVTAAVRGSGYPLVFTERMGIQTNSHMCGTAVAGHDPDGSVVNPDCRSHDLDNLWIVDGSFFASSAALNPALTIAANALRVAERILA